MPRVLHSLDLSTALPPPLLLLSSFSSLQVLLSKLFTSTSYYLVFKEPNFKTSTCLPTSYAPVAILFSQFPTDSPTTGNLEARVYRRPGQRVRTASVKYESSSNIILEPRSTPPTREERLAMSIPFSKVSRRFTP